jgi:hypothetical protein
MGSEGRESAVQQNRFFWQPFRPFSHQTLDALSTDTHPLSL